MDPFLGEIRMFSGGFAPSGWALCNGQPMSISQNSALFSILGTTYGGNGTTTFNLPNLQGALPMHWGPAKSGTQYVYGQVGGSEAVTLAATHVPAHNHLVGIQNVGATTSDPTNGYIAEINTGDTRNPITTTVAFGAPGTATTGNLAANTVSMFGGSQPHSNMQPYVCVTYIIALQGIFPSRG